MPAVCVTVTEGPLCLVNGKALRVDESHMLESVLTEVCGTASVYDVEHMKNLCKAGSMD